MGARIEAKVDEILASGNVFRAQKYATMLHNQAARLDEVYGVPVVRRKVRRFERAEITRQVVLRVTLSNPSWPLTHVAKAAGVSIGTVHRLLHSPLTPEDRAKYAPSDEGDPE
jgi:hypothetical protein